jgi:hypothetical protein
MMVTSSMRCTTELAHSAGGFMTELLKPAVAELEKLPASQQDQLASIVLAEINSEARWSNMLQDSAEALERLAIEALSD